MTKKIQPTPDADQFNLAEIKRIIRVVETASIEELTLEKGEFKIGIRKSGGAHPTVSVSHSMPAAAAQPRPLPPEPDLRPTPKSVEINTENAITSPMVGTFYVASSPDTPDYVKVGDTVKVGQVLCIIEAMKLFNEIESDRDGVVEKILAKNAQSVEYGQPLFVIRPE